MQDYNFCMKTENNQDDEGTLPWFACILNFTWASREPSKIKQAGNFEKHDQLITELGTQYLCNAFQNYMAEHPDSLLDVKCEKTAQYFVLEFLSVHKIEFYFELNRAEDKKADDLLTYCRQGFI